MSTLDTAENMASKTTVEEDLKTAGQRKINNVWEYTQAMIAMAIVLTTCFGVIANGKDTSFFSPQWWTVLGLVIGFYFGRTNHARVGDVTQRT